MSLLLNYPVSRDMQNARGGTEADLQSGTILFLRKLSDKEENSKVINDSFSSASESYCCY
jgi:hypothetical protein